MLVITCVIALNRTSTNVEEPGGEAVMRMLDDDMDLNHEPFRPLFGLSLHLRHLSH